MVFMASVRVQGLEPCPDAQGISSTPEASL
jgi:hypothetical protein